MKFKQRRKLNCRIYDIYNKYKKDEKVNGITFIKALESLFLDFKNELSSNDFDSFLQHRYKFLRNDYRGTYNLAVNLITAFVPAVCLTIFNDKMFESIQGSRIVWAVLFAFFVIFAFTLIVVFFSGIMITPWINSVFKKSYIDKQNDEIKLICDKLNKRFLMEKIDKKEIRIKALLDTIVSVALSIVIWIILCL